MKLALWLLVLVCALAVPARAAPRVATADRPAHTEGSLVTRQGGEVVDVPLEHTEVAIRVDGPLAEATVTQRFKNPYSAKIEAVYLFPLPTGAAVGGLTISSGGRTIRGTIQERAKATQIYVAARERGLVAALLTQERPNVFTQSVASLEPSATVEVTLTYVQRLPYEDGGYELVFPMMAETRHVPASSPAGAAATASAVQPAALPPGLRSAHDIGLRVELDAGVPIEGIQGIQGIQGIESPSHRIAIERPPGASARAAVKLRPSDTIPNKDFVLRYRAAGAAPRFGVLTHRAGGIGSFMLLAQPPAAPAASQIAPREIIFALDTSSSMRGRPLAKAKDVIRRILRGLSADDTFQLVRFADRASPLAPAPIASKPRNVELVLDWLAALDAGGGAEVVTGIDAALAVPHDPARLRIVVFLTDGYVGDEDEILRRVGQGLNRAGPEEPRAEDRARFPSMDARLFVFGVGTAVNRYLLEELAAIGRGAAQVVRPDEDSAAAVDAFERRIAAPVLTDLRVDWGGLAVTDVSPRAIPDLFAGQPLVLAGHYTSPGAGVITVRGKQAGRDVSFPVPVTLPVLDAGRPAVAAVWARQRIAELSRQLVRAADPAGEREVLALALAHRLLTPYTAFVAVDEARATAGGAPRRVAVPVEVPEGVRGILDGSAAGYAYYPGYGFAARGLVLRNSFADAASPFRSEAPGPDRFPGPDPYGGNSGGRIGSGALGADPERTVAEIVAGRARSPALAMARRTARATFTIPAPIVEGGDADRDVIRRHVRRRQPRLGDCYERELAASPGLAGTVNASFTVGESGLVSGATAAGLGNARVEACIAQVLGALALPRLSSGPARVRYAFVLKPPSPERP